MNVKPETENMPLSFEERLNGRFEGILSWADFDALMMQLLHSDEPWYFYEVGKEVPETQSVEEDWEDDIGFISSTLHENHKEDYCGIVYVDNSEEPTLVKVFGPKNLGASCGSSGSKTWPRWILSHIPPTTVGVKLDEKGKPAWWKSFNFKR